jgi:TolB protein
MADVHPVRRAVLLDTKGDGVAVSAPPLVVAHMRRYVPVAVLALLIVPSTMRALGQVVASRVGIFEGRGDVGKVLHEGSVVFDAARKTYTISGSGHNMWATEDAFHYVWKRVSGDVSIAADIAWSNTGGNPHKKAVLVIRQSLDADSAYADAAAHGDGTFSLQGREDAGAATHEVQANAPRPVRLKLQKSGDYFYMSYAGEGEALKLSGGAIRVTLREPFYVGIGVCAHDPNAIESATFANVAIEPGAPKAAPGKGRVFSTIETITVSSTDRRAVQVIEGRVESPTWTMDNTFIYSVGGRLQRIPVAGGTPSPVDAASPGREAGPEKSPDGGHIYYTAESAGRMQIWRKRADGSEPEALTSDAYSNWFPHPSPDGQRLVFLSYPKGAAAPGTKDVPYSDVLLRVMTLADRRVTVLAKILGGRGTIDLPSWSPDSRRLAFVSYLLLP